MQYSVFNTTTKLYDYFKTPDSSSDLNVPIPNHLYSRKGGELGIPIDKTLWPLPTNAIYTGRGSLPKGMISSSNNNISTGDFDLLSPLPLVTIGILVYLLVKHV